MTKINRRAGWFEMQPRGGGRLTIGYDEATTLIDFQTMQEIRREQPVEVIYLPAG